MISDYRHKVAEELWFAYGIRYETLHKRHWRMIDAMFTVRRPITVAAAKVSQ